MKHYLFACPIPWSSTWILAECLFNVIRSNILEGEILPELNFQISTNISFNRMRIRKKNAFGIWLLSNILFFQLFTLLQKEVSASQLVFWASQVTITDLSERHFLQQPTDNEQNVLLCCEIASADRRVQLTSPTLSNLFSVATRNFWCHGAKWNVVPHSILANSNFDSFVFI